MTQVMTNPTVRNADRIEAAKWLADRGFGRATQGVEIDIAQNPTLDLAAWSAEDIRTLISIVRKYEPDRDDVIPAAGELRVTTSA